MKGTMTLYQMNLTDLDLISDYEGSEDEFFLANPENLLLPNAGAGIFYYTQRSFIGLSAPKLLRNQLDKRNTTAYFQMEGKEEPTLYLAAGKLWRLDRDYQFQPTVIIKATNNAPLSAGFYANLYIFDSFRVGVFYHLNEVAGALLQYEYEGKWKFGYSVDVAANRLIQTNYGSHELMLSYSLAPKRKRIVYPRYF
jgi:type IX secretion system PorP/SprF family membrane protein